MRSLDVLTLALTVTPSTPSPSVPSLGEAATSAPSGIIVTAITTVGVVLVALITNYRRRDTGQSAPPPVSAIPAVPAGVPQEDSRQNERIAVLEFQMKDVRERVDSVERKVERHDREDGARDGR